MATTKGGKGGVGVLVVMGLVAVGYSNGLWGSGTPSEAGLVETEPTTCDGVLVVDGAVVPADMNSPAGTATTSCRMDVGDGSEAAVTALQRSLAECHGQSVTVDGEYGPETAGAVSAVQEQGGITVDGEYGPATLGVMRWPVEDAGSAAGSECVARGSQSGLVADVTDPVLPATG
jgi:peptidoglycan hydrolase-like protein with peptidoglycan-binding domain